MGGGGYGGGGGGGYGGGGGGGYGGGGGSSTSLRDVIDVEAFAEEGMEAGRGAILMRGGMPGDMIILQTPDIHSQIEDLLTTLRKHRNMQVSVDARFLEVKDDALQEFGIQINNFVPHRRHHYMFTDPSNSAPITNPVQPPTAATPTPPPGYVYSGPFLNEGDFINTGTTTGGPGMSMRFSIFDSFHMSGIIKAAQSVSESESVSCPRVTLTNGQLGSVTVGTDITYVGSYTATSGIATPQVSTVHDGVTFDVRPIISADRRYVYLELAPSITSVTIQEFRFAAQSSTTGLDGGSLATNTVLQMPSTFEQSVNTTVCVPDQGLLLLGGLSIRKERTTQQGVPFLSKIPIVKLLFSGNNTTKTRNNLIILVRPEILIQSEKEAEIP